MIYKRDNQRRRNYVCGQYTRLRDTVMEDGCRPKKEKGCIDVEIINAERELKHECSHTTRIRTGVCRNEGNGNRSKAWHGLGSGQGVLGDCEALASCTQQHGLKL